MTTSTRFIRSRIIGSQNFGFSFTCIRLITSNVITSHNFGFYFSIFLTGIKRIGFYFSIFLTCITRLITSNVITSHNFGFYFSIFLIIVIFILGDSNFVYAEADNLKDNLKVETCNFSYARDLPYPKKVLDEKTMQIKYRPEKFYIPINNTGSGLEMYIANRQKIMKPLNQNFNSFWKIWEISYFSKIHDAVDLKFLYTKTQPVFGKLYFSLQDSLRFPLLEYYIPERREFERHNNMKTAFGFQQAREFGGHFFWNIQPSLGPRNTETLQDIFFRVCMEKLKRKYAWLDIQEHSKKVLCKAQEILREIKVKEAIEEKKRIELKGWLLSGNYVWCLTEKQIQEGDRKLQLLEGIMRAADVRNLKTFLLRGNYVWYLTEKQIQEGDRKLQLLEGIMRAAEESKKGKEPALTDTVPEILTCSGYNLKLNETVCPTLTVVESEILCKLIIKAGQCLKLNTIDLPIDFEEILYNYLFDNWMTQACPSFGDLNEIQFKDFIDFIKWGAVEMETAVQEEQIIPLQNIGNNLWCLTAKQIEEGDRKLQLLEDKMRAVEQWNKSKAPYKLKFDTTVSAIFSSKDLDVLSRLIVKAGQFLNISSLDLSIGVERKLLDYLFEVWATEKCPSFGDLNYIQFNAFCKKVKLGLNTTDAEQKMFTYHCYNLKINETVCPTMTPEEFHILSNLIIKAAQVLKLNIIDLNLPIDLEKGLYNYLFDNWMTQECPSFGDLNEMQFNYFVGFMKWGLANMEMEAAVQEEQIIPLQNIGNNLWCLTEKQIQEGDQKLQLLEGIMRAADVRNFKTFLLRGNYVWYLTEKQIQEGDGIQEGDRKLQLLEGIMRAADVRNFKTFLLRGNYVWYLTEKQIQEGDRKLQLLEGIMRAAEESKKGKESVLTDAVSEILISSGYNLKLDETVCPTLTGVESDILCKLIIKAGQALKLNTIDLSIDLEEELYNYVLEQWFLGKTSLFGDLNEIHFNEFCELVKKGLLPVMEMEIVAKESKKGKEPVWTDSLPKLTSCCYTLKCNKTGFKLNQTRDLTREEAEVLGKLIIIAGQFLNIINLDLSIKVDVEVELYDYLFNLWATEKCPSFGDLNEMQFNYFVEIIKKGIEPAIVAKESKKGKEPVLTDALPKLTSCCYTLKCNKTGFKLNQTRDLTREEAEVLGKLIIIAGQFLNIINLDLSIKVDVEVELYDYLFNLWATEKCPSFGDLNEMQFNYFVEIIKKGIELVLTDAVPEILISSGYNLKFDKTVCPTLTGVEADILCKLFIKAKQLINIKNLDLSMDIEVEMYDWLLSYWEAELCPSFGNINERQFYYFVEIIKKKIAPVFKAPVQMPPVWLSADDEREISCSSYNLKITRGNKETRDICRFLILVTAKALEVDINTLDVPIKVEEQLYHTLWIWEDMHGDFGWFQSLWDWDRFREILREGLGLKEKPEMKPSPSHLIIADVVRTSSSYMLKINCRTSKQNDILCKLIIKAGRVLKLNTIDLSWESEELIYAYVREQWELWKTLLFGDFNEKDFNEFCKLIEKCVQRSLR